MPGFLQPHPLLVQEKMAVQQPRIDITLKGPKISGMSIGFNLKSPAVIALNKRVRLSFEALKQGVDFFLAMKVLLVSSSNRRLFVISVV